MSGKHVNKENEDWFVRQVELGKLEVFEDGRVRNPKTNTFIGAIGSGRYVKISIKDMETGKIRSIQVHRLVYRVFKGPIPDGCEIDHDDNDHSHNSLDNLVVLTPKQNVQKALKDGLLHAFPVGNTFWEKGLESRKKNLGY